MSSGQAADDQLTDELRALASRIDPPPEEVLRAARGAFTWRTVDDELAALTYDSLLDNEALAGVRGPANGQTVTYEGRDLSIDVAVEPQPGNRRRLVAQIAPPQSAAVEVRHREGVTATEADELGRFRVNSIPAGPVSLRCTPRGGRAVSTEWTAL